MRWQPYKSWFWGLGITLVLAAIFLGWSRHAGSPGARNDGYAAQLAIENAHVERAQSMMAGGVVFWEGTLVNRGDRTLAGYRVALTFHDESGNVVQQQQRDLLGSGVLPLPPHSARAFQLGFDDLAGSWNQVPPDALPVAVWVK